MEILKSKIKQLASGTSNGVQADSEQRSTIESTIEELAACNPTADIATSDLMTGETIKLLLRPRVVPAGHVSGKHEDALYLPSRAVRLENL